MGMFCMIAGPGALAQPVVLDDFESYANTMALKAVWQSTGGFAEASLAMIGGADGTARSVILTDAGFYAEVTAANLPGPPAGKYRLGFFYRNGQSSSQPWRNLRVSLIQGGVARTTLTLGSTSVPNWTPAESSVMTLDSSPVTIRVGGPDVSVPQDTYRAALDEVKLIPVVPPPLTASLFRPASILISTTQTITAVPSGGEGAYSSVEFDAGNDGTFEHADTVPPYEYVWDTTNAVPMGTTGTAVLAVRVNDFDLSSGTILATYTVDNRNQGRSSLITNGDFSSFSGNLPIGWVPWQTGAGAVYGPGPDRNGAAGQGLRYSFASSVQGGRYLLRSEPGQGVWANLQVWYWGKGSSNRVDLFVSHDEGFSWINTGYGASAAGSDWTFAVGTPYTHPGMTGTTMFMVAPHQTDAGDHLFDEIGVEGTLLPPPTTAETWMLYE